LLTVLDRYLIREILLTCLVMTGIGLAILVLERLLRLFALVANPNQAFSYVGQIESLSGWPLIAENSSDAPCRPIMWRKSTFPLAHLSCIPLNAARECAA
jgi:hypothetical protein